MLHIFRTLSQMSFRKLMMVYEEGNLENASLRYSAMDKNAAILQAEQDFYAYLRDCFFRSQGAFYAVWVENGNYVSALRMEPFFDGFLMEALETEPSHRRKGYASLLIRSVLKEMDAPVYSHVKKDNLASLRVHFSCGFDRVSDSAQLIDGTISDCYCTLRWGR